ncbi:creatininase family protein [Paenibacillus sp. GCM10027626]|uniref:creatininase family protein n=1 Tax=Paenibacillus sp. GCM10027626 TaxID=3273411 RepID=UPI003635B0F3
MSVLWSDYTTEELQRIILQDNPVVIVPVGATEQHGPHLAVNTDTDIGEQLARKVAQHAPVQTLVLPSVWAGFSPHHMGFTGTITLRQSTLTAVLLDIAESLIRHGVRKILLLNSHGGNAALMKTVTDEIGIRHGVYPVSVTYWHLISDLIPQIRRSEAGGMAHACELETSLKMIFTPEDIRPELISDVMIEANEFYGVDMFAANKIGIYRPFEYWSRTGQIGAPSLASRETGERILAALLKKFAELYRIVWSDEEDQAKTLISKGESVG